MPISVTANKSTLSVGLGQTVFVREGEIAQSVLGSCVGLVIYHEIRRVAAMTHVVLPEGANRSGPPGKFADTAVPHMLAELFARHQVKSGLVAKLAGGANMFGSKGPIQIGEANIVAVKRMLGNFDIPLAGEHLGGNCGRRVCFDPASGECSIEVHGQPVAVI